MIESNNKLLEQQLTKKTDLELVGILNNENNENSIKIIQQILDKRQVSYNSQSKELEDKKKINIYNENSITKKQKRKLIILFFINISSNIIFNRVSYMKVYDKFFIYNNFLYRFLSWVIWPILQTIILFILIFIIVFVFDFLLKFIILRKEKTIHSYIKRSFYNYTRNILILSNIFILLMIAYLLLFLYIRM